MQEASCKEAFMITLRKLAECPLTRPGERPVAAAKQVGAFAFGLLLTAMTTARNTTRGGEQKTMSRKRREAEARERRLAHLCEQDTARKWGSTRFADSSA